MARGHFSRGDKAGVVYWINGLLVVGVHNDVVDHGWNDLEQQDGGDVVERMVFPCKAALFFS